MGQAHRLENIRCHMQAARFAESLLRFGVRLRLANYVVAVGPFQHGQQAEVVRIGQPMQGLAEVGAGSSWRSEDLMPIPAARQISPGLLSPIAIQADLVVEAVLSAFNRTGTCAGYHLNVIHSHLNTTAPAAYRPLP
jgi:hypothetical protein